jgi:hypothetical protein
MPPNPDGPPSRLSLTQEAGLKVKEFELLRRNFSDSGNFGAPPAARLTSTRCVLLVMRGGAMR